MSDRPVYTTKNKAGVTIHADTDDISDVIDALEEGDKVWVNDRRAQRVVNVVPQGVIIRGDWDGAADYELHSTDPTLYPMHMERRFHDEQYSIYELTVERVTPLTRWI